MKDAKKYFKLGAKLHCFTNSWQLNCFPGFKTYKETAERVGILGKEVVVLINVNGTYLVFLFITYLIVPAFTR